MAKISKRRLALHNEAMERLQKDVLTWDDKEFIFENFHEGAGRMNNLISAHFTPQPIAQSMTFMVGRESFIDLCAGIGMLAYRLFRQWQFSNNAPDAVPPKAVCVELDREYYEIGKKLVPQFKWINGDIFDPEVIQEIREYMGETKFSVISNPPYGKQVKTDTKELLHYTGSSFEYKAIELGALLGAQDGTFLIPQQSAPFRMTGDGHKSVESDEYKTRDYLKFEKQTGIEIRPNNGFTTEINEDWKGWKDVSVVTEIAVIEYYECEYKPKQQPKEEPQSQQTTLF